MRRVHWTDTAIRDIAELKEELTAIHPEVAKAVLARIAGKVRFLLENPKSAAPTGHRDWRHRIVSKTSRVIVYRPDRDGILVLRVLHAHSDRRKP